MSDATERSEHGERILGCACELYLRDGFEGFSMRKLAREVGVTAPALYRHYDGKEALLLEVVKEAFKVMAQHLYTALGGSDARERFRMAGQAYLDFAMEHPRFYEITYSYHQWLGLDDPPAEIAPLACGIGQFWNDRVRECMDAGFLADDDPDAVSLALWAQAHGLISVYQRGLLGVGPDGFRELYRAQMGRLIAGVGSDEDRIRVRDELASAHLAYPAVEPKRETEVSRSPDQHPVATLIEEEDQ
jgi:AcrR family transcriptional regulator